MLVLCIVDVVLVMMASLPITDSMGDLAPNMWQNFGKKFYGNHWIVMQVMTDFWMVTGWGLLMAMLNRGSCRTKAPLDAEHFAGRRRESDGITKS